MGRWVDAHLGRGHPAFVLMLDGQTAEIVRTDREGMVVGLASGAAVVDAQCLSCGKIWLPGHPGPVRAEYV